MQNQIEHLTWKTWEWHGATEWVRCVVGQGAEEGHMAI